MINKYRNIGKYAKLFSLLLLGAVTISVSSCQNNDNDLFDKDPIVRLREAQQEMKNHLVNDSENGWIVTFSPDGGKYLGEFNLWFDFEDDWKVNIKSDLDLGDLGVEESYYNFTMLRTFALSFPVHNKVHDFTEFDPYSLRTDIEFMFNSYLDNGDIETVGFMTNKKVVFHKATAEHKQFDFSGKWAIYNRLEQATSAQLFVDGVRTNYAYAANEGYRSSFIGGSNTGYLTETGVVTFGVQDDLTTIKLAPALELPNGLTIDELSWTGSFFYGEADSDNYILIQ